QHHGHPQLRQRGAGRRRQRRYGDPEYQQRRGRLHHSHSRHGEIRYRQRPGAHRHRCGQLHSHPAHNLNPHHSQRTHSHRRHGQPLSDTSANISPYDRNTTATLNFGSAALVGVVSGDTVTLNTNSAVGAFTTPTVGTAKSVTVSGLSLSGTDAANYTLTQPTT